MLLHRLTGIDDGVRRAEPDGDLTRGALFVGTDGIVRWIAERDILGMEGVGEYNGGRGYNVYEAASAGHARLA